MGFIKENYISIIVLSILLFGSLVIFSILDDYFKDIPPFNRINKKDKRVVNIETFDNTELPDAFCKKYQPTPHLLKQHCKNLGVRGCHMPKCFVLINGKECVPGDSSGPTFLTENGIRNNITSLEHQGKKI